MPIAWFKAKSPLSVLCVDDLHRIQGCLTCLCLFLYLLKRKVNSVLQITLTNISWKIRECRRFIGSKEERVSFCLAILPESLQCYNHEMFPFLISYHLTYTSILLIVYGDKWWWYYWSFVKFGRLFTWGEHESDGDVSYGDGDKGLFINDVITWGGGGGSVKR